jgi:hypothetical protein
MRNLLMTISIFLLSLVVSGQNLTLDVDKQYMLTPEKGISKNLVDAFFEFYDIPVIQYFDKLNTYVVKVEDVQEFMAACEIARYFAIIEKDREETVKMDYIPTDPEFVSCWHLRQSSDKDIDADEAWDLLPAGNQWVSVAMFDGGLDLTHPDLAGNTDSPFNAVNGTSSVPYVNAEDKHGTACSGTIAAVTNNDIGVASVGNNKVKVMPVNIMSQVYAGGSFSTTSSIQVAGVNAAMSNPNCVAIAMSYGGSSYSATLENAFLTARSSGRGGKGMMIFASSGNGSSGTAAQYPANYNGVWGVGATNSSDVRASFSNFGQICDISAPGASIRTTDRVGADGYSSSGDYTTISGTSFSCPITAAASAVIAYKNWELTDDEILQILSSTCEKVGGYNYTNNPSWPYSTRSNELGYGRINLKNAVIATPDPGTPPPPPPAPVHNFFAESLNVNPSVVNVGDAIAVNFNVKTTEPSLDTVVVSTQYRYSVNTTWGDSDDIIIGTSTSQLGGGVSTEAESFSYTVGGNAGSRYILVKVNFDGSVTENNQTDNTTSRVFTVNDPAFSGTDIKVELFMPSSNPITTSAQILNTKWKVTNIGSTTVTTISYLRRWVNCPGTGWGANNCVQTVNWTGTLLPGQVTYLPSANGYISVNLCHNTNNCAVPVGGTNTYRLDLISVNGLQGDGNTSNNRVDLVVSRISTNEEDIIDNDVIIDNPINVTGEDFPISFEFYTITGMLLDITRFDELPAGIYIARENYKDYSLTYKLIK